MTLKYFNKEIMEYIAIVSFKHFCSGQMVNIQ